MKNILMLLTACCIFNICLSQNIPGVQTACTTAFQGTAGNFIISYTIGEMPLVESWKSNGLLITQGIIQPQTFIAETNYECFSQTEVRLFPNPTPGIFSVQLNFFKTGKANIILIDVAGRQILKDEFDYNTFIIKKYDVSKLASGMYLLQLFFTETGSNSSKKCVYNIEKMN
jgi:Secretion system C-terminal sorting domain